MATCKECIHHAVCKTYGEVFVTRTDVQDICENYMQKPTREFLAELERIIEKCREE